MRKLIYILFLVVLFGCNTGENQAVTEVYKTEIKYLENQLKNRKNEIEAVVFERGKREGEVVILESVKTLVNKTIYQNDSLNQIKTSLREKGFVFNKNTKVENISLTQIESLLKNVKIVDSIYLEIDKELYAFDNEIILFKNNSTVKNHSETPLKYEYVRYLKQENADFNYFLNGKPIPSDSGVANFTITKKDLIDNKIMVDLKFIGSTGEEVMFSDTLSFDKN